MNLITAGIACLIVLFTAGAAFAPEAGLADRGDLGGLVYRVEGDGRLVDENGNPKGWMIGNEVYDNGWNLKYRLERRKLHDISGV
jgi:hypothetical protein